jgi:hypothetical protein
MYFSKRQKNEKTEEQDHSEQYANQSFQNMNDKDGHKVLQPSLYNSTNVNAPN